MRITYTLESVAYTAATLIALSISGCGAPPLKSLPEPAPYEYKYIVGPGDSLSIFVWRNSELSQNVTVRPDGRFSAPLVEDLLASGKTPSQLAREIEDVLSRYIRNPLVTVIVANSQGVFETQVRVVGEATTPQALPYRANMTILDVMIAVGGLTEFAAGNRAKIVRTVRDRQVEMRIRLEDLIKDGDMSGNVRMAPGDIVVIPEAWF